jgi:hypothetical protein
MGWNNDTFPKADDPLDVGWMISYWRVVPCESCTGNYSLQSAQFDHLPLAATRAEAIAKWRHYLRQKRRSGQADSIKGLTIFLTKVVKVGVVSDFSGDMDTSRGDDEDST